MTIKVPQGITVWTDKNGITREYREVKRKARVGELVKVNASCGEAAKVIDRICRVVENQPGFDWWSTHGVETDSAWPDGSTLNPSHDDYVVLEPTDIIHYDGKRWREVERKAKVGELVMKVGTDVSFGRPNGSVWKVIDEDHLWGGRHRDGTGVTLNDGKPISHENYVVLEPIENTTTPAIEERVAALEKRVAELEKYVADRKQQYQSLLDKLREPVVESIPRPKQYTRAEVIELAKRDVDDLMASDHENVPAVFGGHLDYNSTISEQGCVDFVEFCIDRKKRAVVALIRMRDMNVTPPQVTKPWARGIAHFAPDDCFNIHIGRAISLRRALGLPVPDYYLNAPQPTEAQVGDVVRMNHSGNTRTIEYRRPERDRIDSGKAFWFTSGTWDWEEAFTIIDDSHDFGGEQPQSGGVAA